MSVSASDTSTATTAQGQPPITTDKPDAAQAFRFHYPIHTFAQAPEWIQYAPPPGVYSHPLYGEVEISIGSNIKMVEEFTSGVYQDRLPVDAEHETKLSGAFGWIVEMRVAEDYSVEARVEWSGRGKAMFEDNRFRYFSPEWWPYWEDPVTNEIHEQVAVGGALTNDGFFKNLRPLIATQTGTYTAVKSHDEELGEVVHYERMTFRQPAAETGENVDVESEAASGRSTQDMSDKTKVGPQDEERKAAQENASLTESGEENQGTASAASGDEGNTGQETPSLAEQLAEADLETIAASNPAVKALLDEKAQLEAAKAETEQFSAKQAREFAQMQSQMKAMQHERLTERFTNEVRGLTEESPAPWIGDPEENVARLHKMTELAGGDPDNEVVQGYIHSMRLAASQAHSGELFKRKGLNTRHTGPDPISQFDQLIAAKQAQGLNYGDAVSAASRENPQLYRQYSKLSSARTGV